MLTWKNVGSYLRVFTVVMIISFYYILRNPALWRYGQVILWSSGPRRGWGGEYLQYA